MPACTTEHVIAFDVSPSGGRYAAPAAVTGVLPRPLRARVARRRRAERGGLVSHLPMYRFGWNGEMTREGGNPWGADDNPLVEYRSAVWRLPEDAWHSSPQRGRTLDTRDGLNTLAVLVNQAMAEKFWPNEDPIGRRFGQGGDLAAYYTVVGVGREHPVLRPGGVKSPYEFYRTIDQVAVPGDDRSVALVGSGARVARPERARGIVVAPRPERAGDRVQSMADVVERVSRAAAAPVGAGRPVRRARRPARDGRRLRRQRRPAAGDSGTSTASGWRSARIRRRCSG